MKLNIPKTGNNDRRVQSMLLGEKALSLAVRNRPPSVSMRGVSVVGDAYFRLLLKRSGLDK